MTGTHGQMKIGDQMVGTFQEWVQSYQQINGFSIFTVSVKKMVLVPDTDFEQKVKLFMSSLDYFGCVPAFFVFLYSNSGNEPMMKKDACILKNQPLREKEWLNAEIWEQSSQ